MQAHRTATAQVATALLILTAACDGDGDAVGDTADTLVDAGTDVADTADAVLPPVDLTATVPAGEARAGVSTDAGELIGGRKAEGLAGDIKMMNATAEFVIEGLRRGGGFRQFGGNLVDADLARDAGSVGRDLFGELFFAFNLTAMRPEAVDIIADGRGGGPAHVRFSGELAPVPFIQEFVGNVFNSEEVTGVEAVYDYVLQPDSATLDLTITLTSRGVDPVRLSLPAVFVNQGDGTRTYVPGEGFGRLQGSNGIRALGFVGSEISYGFACNQLMTGIISISGVSVVQLPVAILDPDVPYVIEAQFAVGDGGTEVMTLVGDPAPVVGTVSGQVMAPLATTPGDIWVTATRDFEVAAVLPVGEDFGFSASLPPGEYALQAFVRGIGGSAETQAVVVEDDTTQVALGPFGAGTVTVTAVDGDGEAVPAQITFFYEDGEIPPAADDAVDLDVHWGRGRTSVGFVGLDPLTVAIPAGTYRAVASRGYGHDLDSHQVVVTADTDTALTVTLVEVVDRAGWISGDFHLHGQWSPDSDVYHEDRVRQIAAVDLDLVIITEHVNVGNAAPHIHDFGLSDRVANVPAQEVTTFGYGHFNAYPLAFKPDEPNFGAVIEHGHTGADLFTAIREQSGGEVVIQVNHPRGSAAQSYFDATALDSARDAVGNPERWSLDWDAVEVFNGGCSGGVHRVRDDWVHLTSHGYRKALSSGSDSHRLTTPPGHPRNWIPVALEDVQADPTALVPAFHNRRGFTSCGPFVRFAAEDGTPMGGLTSTDDNGTVRFAVSVQAPTWIDVREVRLLRNGVTEQTFDVQAQAAGVLRFDDVIEAGVTEDAWFAIEVIGDGDLAPVHYGDPPYALTNPIEVDADGDGAWTPPGVHVEDE